MKPDAPTERFTSLDGWRATSILLVLACHLFPLGIPGHQININVGMMGMAIFFILSGHLITTSLLQSPPPETFIIRRAARVLPLAWVYITVSLALSAAPFKTWVDHYLFTANLPTANLTITTDHLWSLCIEVQFYVVAFFMYALFGKKSLLALIAACLGITALKIIEDIFVSSITYYRADELLAGGVLALALNNKTARGALQALTKLVSWPLLMLFFIFTCFESSYSLHYFRPYSAALLVGATLVQPSSLLSKSLGSKHLTYIAQISFALYVIHPLLAHSWLGSGDLLEKYMKRPLLLAILFVLAHISTRYMEQPITNWARRLPLLSNRINRRST